MLKRTLLYPWTEAATVGTYPLILRGGEAIGVLALPLEGEGEPNKRRKASIKDLLDMFQVRDTAVSQ